MRDARPARIDPFEKRARHRRTFQGFEIFFSRSASWRTAHALAFMHAQTGGRDFRVRFPEQRIVTARFQNSQTCWIERKVPVRKEKWRCVPNEPGRLPRFYESQLVWKSFWVSSGRECFSRQNR